MEIRFRNTKLVKVCNSEKLIRREYGPSVAKHLPGRLEDLEAALTLAVAGRLPHLRVHQLTGQREGQLAADVVGTWRIVFEPDHQPLPKKPDGGLDWEAVTKIVIQEVVDYH